VSIWHTAIVEHLSQISIFWQLGTSIKCYEKCIDILRCQIVGKALCHKHAVDNGMVWNLEHPSLLQVLQVIDACTDIAYDVTAPAAGGVVSSRFVFLAGCYLGWLSEWVSVAKDIETSVCLCGRILAWAVFHNEMCAILILVFFLWQVVIIMLI